MADEKVLTRVREAEAKAEKTIASANIAKQKAIDDAQKKANEMRAAAVEKTTKESDAALKAFYGALAKKKEKIISRCGDDVVALKKDGGKKLPRAIDFLFGSFSDKVKEQ